MYGSHIVSGLAVVFAGMSLLFVVFAVVYNPVFLAVAFVFGASAYFVWYHASGRLARRVYRGVENQAEVDAEAGFGAGPREEWESSRDGQRRQAGASGRVSATSGRRRAGTSRQRARRPGAAATDVLTIREAYEALGLDPGADVSAVTEAYREKVKEVHPDRPSGDEDEFKRVTAAYERLSDD